MGTGGDGSVYGAGGHARKKSVGTDKDGTEYSPP